MDKIIKCVICCLLLITALPVFSAEISVYGGSTGSNNLTNDTNNVELDSGSFFALSYSWDYAGMDAVGQGKLLFSRSVREITSEWPAEYEADFATYYAHFIGVAFYQEGNYITTFDVGLGFAQFAPSDSRFSSRYAPSLTTALAARYEVTPSFGVQLEARFYASLVDSSDELFCHNANCLAQFDDDFWLDHQISLGVYWRF